MCGITGVFFLKKDKNFNFNSLREMTSSLSHRGPDPLDTGHLKKITFILGTEDYLF